MMSLQQPPPPPRQIIVVDDDQVEREMLVELLSSPHREVEAFSCAAEALEALPGRSVDIAFIDHMMPGISGAELAGRLKAMFPQVRVFLCSGYIVEASHPKLMNRVERVLHKPLDLGEVLELVDTPAS